LFAALAETLSCAQELRNINVPMFDIPIKETSSLPKRVNEL